ncbi:MAG: hypothetical protein OEZ02_13615 [Anaerolineae bacterium]|nr:hypothetical protein [Anaerolineae bacterium]
MKVNSRSFYLIAALALAAFACSLPARPTAGGPPTPTGAPPTSADLPTQTTPLQPGETASPADPASPAPSDTPNPTPTYTAEPLHGLPLYATDFNNLSGWKAFPWWKSDVHDYAGAGFKAKLSSYVAQIEHGRYHFEVPKKYTNITSIYKVNIGSSDVKITANSILTLDRPWTFISVVCRYTDNGWYEFFIYSSGNWGIMRVSYIDGTYYKVKQLAYDSTSAIKTGDHGLPNQLVATCDRNQLHFSVNGHYLGSTADSTFTSGYIGVGAAAGEQGNSHVDFESLQVDTP